jgi:hypothetical protein
MQHGRTVIPVNPRKEAAHGQPAYASLLDIPESQRVDVVDLFVASANAGAVADDAIKRGAKAVWFQLGVTDAQVRYCQGSAPTWPLLIFAALALYRYIHAYPLMYASLPALPHHTAAHVHRQRSGARPPGFSSSRELALPLSCSGMHDNSCRTVNC